MLTVGQYLQPRADNLPVRRYVTPELSLVSNGTRERWAPFTPRAARWFAPVTTPAGGRAAGVS